MLWHGESHVVANSRRFFLGTALSGLALATIRPACAGVAWVAGDGIAATVLRRALAALERHRNSIDHRDVLGIADFSLPSRTPRFHLLALANGSVESYLVAHGRGSDPGHTGWLEHFSNEPHSNATSAGAYRTAGLYVGAHGHALHLEGLDPTNSQAASRAIVVHGAWYVSQQMIVRCGMLGRSEGCFAVENSSLNEILRQLGPGRLIYADKA